MSLGTSTQAKLPFAPWRDPSAQPLVSVRGLVKCFGDFAAIDHIDLDIFPREFFALLGPSGCGKTTLMRMLAGFESPTSGSIELKNQDIVSTPAHLRPVNMMFQSYALFPHMTVADNIAFGLKQEKQPQSLIEERVEEMLVLVQLQKFAHRKPHQLSGGQKQRVALARTLAKKPQLVLLDEPLGALDKKLRQETQFELMDIQESLGMTFLIVTHDQEEAMTVSSRIAVMNEGKIVQVDTPDEIYENPNSVFVADFLGDANLIPGRLEVRNNDQGLLHWQEGHPGLLVSLPTKWKTAQVQAMQVQAALAANISIRPEKIAISAQKPIMDSTKDTLCYVAGKIIDIAYSGSVSIYHVEVAPGMILKALETNTRRIARRHFTWEDHVWLSWRVGAETTLLS